MSPRRSWRTGVVLATAAAACLVGTALAGASTPTSPGAYVAAPPVRPAAKVKPAAGSLPSTCSDPTIGASWVCYTPAEIKEIYDVPTGGGAPDGSGQTIVIVVAFGNPTIKSDLAAFDSAFDLSDPSLTIVGPNGSGNQSDPNVQNWSFETSMDVEWAHAIAPGAAIVLAVAASDDSHAIEETVANVIPQYPGAIIVQSFGANETFAKQGFIDDKTAHLLYAGAAALGETVVAAAGDFGAAGSPDRAGSASLGPQVWYPASDPFVTAIGGTMGDPYLNTASPDFQPFGLGALVDGHYGAEQTWNESEQGTIDGATGGGLSQIFPSPSYQSGFSKRAVPDVAYDAALFGGVQVIWNGERHTGGGTSEATPQWAGIFALANEQRAAAGKGPLGFANPALYANAGSFHDITSGDNTWIPADPSQPLIPGSSAGPGYDLTTGLGTPDVANLLPGLVAAAGTTSPGQLGPPPPPSQLPTGPDATCQNQQLTGTYHNVRVAKNAWCDLAGATVTGDVQANRATGLGITGTTVYGDVEVNHATGASDPSHPNANVVCASAISGDLRVHDSAAAWSIGGAACAGVTGGPGNAIGDDLQFDNNAGNGSEVSANSVAGTLECRHDTGVTGAGNLAQRLVGQCAAFGTQVSSDGGVSGADVRCQNQQLTGTYHNVKVVRGAWCDLAGATVTGDVRAHFATGLAITGSIVIGKVDVDDTVAALDPSHLGQNVVCNSLVWGDVNITDSSGSAPWSIGGTTGCANVASVTGGTGSAIGSELRFDRNAASTNDVSGNTIIDDLECNGNGGVAASGGPNLVGRNAQGQCASSPLVTG